MRVLNSKFKSASPIFLILAVGLALMLIGPSYAAEKIAIAHLQQKDMETNEVYPAMLHYKRLLEERTGGAFDVEIYPGGQLGNEVETTQEVQQGYTIQMVITSSGAFSAFYKKYQALVQPFLFPDKLTAWTFFDSDYMANFMKGLQKIGLRYLGTMDDGGGFVVLTNSLRPVYSMKDLKGMRIRTEENPSHMAIMNAMGASATPMPWGDVATALATKTAHGQFNAPAVIADNHLWDIQKYVSETRHIYNTLQWLVSESWYQRQSKKHQIEILRAAREAIHYSRSLAEHLSLKAVIASKEHGMIWNSLTPENIEKMRKASQAGYRKWVVEDYGLTLDLLDSVKNEVNHIYAANGKELVRKYGQ
jgi:TRAP-type C4-dicarboxylate transport system substrate-binding protein